MTESSISPPTEDERRHAACQAMGSAPGLIRYAARFTRSLHDAEDAYQRAMELALTRAPVVEPARFMAWLRTVLRNEALAVSAARKREGPALGADVSDGYGEVLEDRVAVDVLAEWRDRYRSIQDGLAGLSDAQRICLMLQSAGASYERIRDITGFSLRKVERSVLEGRAGLAAWELRLASGDACAGLDEMITLVATAQASMRERRVVSRHIKHCGACRATLRERRESNEWLGALVPVALLGGQAMAGAPDPTPVIAWWERVGDGATVRVGTMVHMAMDLPGSALAKVGAGTAAVVVAGAAALPMVVDGPPAPARAPEPVVAGTAPARPIAGVAPRSGARQVEASFARARRVAADALAAKRATAAAARARRERSSAVSRSSAQVVSAPTRPAAPAASPPASPAVPAASPTTAEVALEFGP